MAISTGARPVCPPETCAVALALTSTLSMPNRRAKVIFTGPPAEDAVRRAVTRTDGIPTVGQPVTHVPSSAS